MNVILSDSREICKWLWNEAALSALFILFVAASAAATSQRL